MTIDLELVVERMHFGGPLHLCDRIEKGDKLVRVDDTYCWGFEGQVVKDLVLVGARSKV